MAVFSAIMPETAVAAAKTLIRLSAPTAQPVYVLRAWVKSSGGETSNQLSVQIMRVTSDGTGTAGTFRQMDGDGGAIPTGGTFSYNLTAEPIAGDILLDMGFNTVGDGFEWVATPLEQIVVPAAGRIALELTEAPAASTDLVAGFIIQTAA